MNGICKIQCLRAEVWFVVLRGVCSMSMLASPEFGCVSVTCLPLWKPILFLRTFPKAQVCYCTVSSHVWDCCLQSPLLHCKALLRLGKTMFCSFASRIANLEGSSCVCIENHALLCAATTFARCSWPRPNRLTYTCHTNWRASRSASRSFLKWGPHLGALLTWPLPFAFGNPECHWHEDSWYDRKTPCTGGKSVSPSASRTWKTSRVWNPFALAAGAAALEPAAASEPTQNLSIVSAIGSLISSSANSQASPAMRSSK